MDIPGKKILIPVEVQAQAQQVILEMKKMIDEMDAKVSKFQSMGFVGMGVAAGAAANQQNFLKKAGVIGVNDSIKEQENLERKVKSGAGFESALNKAIDDTVEEVIDKETSSGGRLDVKKLLGMAGFDSKNMSDWFSMVTNPRGFFQVFFLRVLPILGGVLTAKEIAEFIFHELTARNRPFDLTFRRTINEEFIKLRARELRQQIRVGERQAIFVSEAGVSHPVEIVNTFELVRNGDIFQLDAFRIRKGYQF